ncbi:mitochondrial nicotinamide adenine dinucleotide transporter SLC25A51 [Neocloeon triangulifer]|uniref:mitochondrial nicotinamide adenine dinucleotide transporter SLC25A51 n=1 Tax=Neocloeon triangulifer TaxID=2078957 RepID=UPI00286EF56E|nr:mitochondrial nicotinamide adenine dinucleotide transporter SLC25A51 [Neocloeon triangulifer]
MTSNSSKLLDKKSWQEFACGWGAAFINITVTYPINKVMFRQMLHGLKTKTAVAQLRSEGAWYLYRGMLPPLVQKTLSVSLMFGMYEQYKRIIHTNIPSMPGPLTNATAAMLAGTTEAVLAPCERIQTLLQHESYHLKLKNTAHAFSYVWASHGAKEFYRGLVPILLRNGPSNILFFWGREEVAKRWPTTSNPSLSLVRDFVGGALIGGAISTLFYPINVVKAHMQAQLGGPFHPLTQVWREVSRERGGWRKMFLGVHVNYTRALISWGVINASYELLKNLFVDT